MSGQRPGDPPSEVRLYHHSNRVRLYTADAALGLRRLAGHSVDCVVTSPPYWGLRDYRILGQLGQEPTIEDYISRLLDVFAELHRVLTPAGTVWLNLADTYGGSWGEYIAPGSTAPTATQRADTPQGRRRPPQSRYRRKDLQGIPWRVAQTLLAAGWLVQAAIVWHKPNARPESVRDRLAQRHELLFLLTHETDHYWNPATPLHRMPRVWSIPTPRGRRRHAAPGPVKLAQRALDHGCPPGGHVLDPFSGSGTTGVAALTTGRRNTGIDLDPTAHATALTRLRPLDTP